MLNSISMASGSLGKFLRNTSRNLHTIKISARFQPLSFELMAQARKASHPFLSNLSVIMAKIIHKDIMFLSPMKHTLYPSKV